MRYIIKEKVKNGIRKISIFIMFRAISIGITRFLVVFSTFFSKS